MATTDFRLQGRIDFAKDMTSEVANMKDWRVRNKHNRAMREIARELVESNGGYLIASPNELAERYPGMFESNPVNGDTKMVWCIGTESIKFPGTARRFSFWPV